MRRALFCLFLVAFLFYVPKVALAQQTGWPTPRIEAKPGTRWWWMGSAVDSVNLEYNLRQYSTAGMGTLEITPIYGVQGNEAAEIPFLSKKWMELYRYTISQANVDGMEIDMNNSTGWPFGGPSIDIKDAACKLLSSEYDVKGGKVVHLSVDVPDPKQKNFATLERLMAYSDKGKIVDISSMVVDGELVWKAPKGNWHLIAAFCGKTLQAVKRAAPGGEGYVLDYFSHNAVNNYLAYIADAFTSTSSPFPHAFFGDSYEVYGADWTPGLFDYFYKLRGYKLEDYLPEFLSETRSDVTSRVVADYRETLSDLLLQNFTSQWTSWAHNVGSTTRGQAHGSPGNLIDLYAAVDIPECEGFGLSDFGIKGLRKDSYTRRNDSDLSMLKYASSAAHIAGKPYTSSETFTWLTEHFRTSLSQCKPDLDLMFISGVNHVFFHGTTYSPKDDSWPGWKFYASIDMSPTNSIWRDAPAFFSYITRCQSFLEYGEPDNDFLLYLPVYDMWYEQEGRLLMFDIHKMKERTPRFIEAVNMIIGAGYDVDYISDKFIAETTCNNGQLITPGGKAYKALIIPHVRLINENTLRRLLILADEGAKIVFLGNYPEDVPGLRDLDKRRQEFASLLAELQNKGDCVILAPDLKPALDKTGVTPETLRRDFSLSYIRRSNESGHHYFISALTPNDVDTWVPLAVSATSAVLYNPMDGSCGKALLRRNDGQTEVYLQLKSGQSTILRTYDTDVEVAPYPYYEQAGGGVALDGEWEFRFIESEPQAVPVADKVSLGSWTNYDGQNTANTMGTALYTIRFTLPQEAEEWLLSLGDVRESARVRLNGQTIATLWAVPYECYIGEYLHPGENILEVEVTNLPANRIADMDRRGVKWRKFKDANVVTIDYRPGDYSQWEPVASGLLGPVKLIPLRSCANDLSDR